MGSGASDLFRALPNTEGYSIPPFPQGLSHIQQLHTPLPSQDSYPDPKPQEMTSQGSPGPQVIGPSLSAVTTAQGRQGLLMCFCGGK